MPGLRFKLWPIYDVERYDWVQVPPDHIGLVIAQVGAPLPTGAKSAVYRPEFGNFADIRAFLDQRRPARRAAAGAASRHHRADPPDRLRRHHQRRASSARWSRRRPSAAVQQVDPAALQVVHITPQGDRDIVGVVTTLEGPPSGDIASRIGGFADVTAMEGRRRLADPGHPGRAALEERPARQLPGLPGVPRQRRLHRPAARPAAVRLVPAQPVPREGRAARDARRAPGRGRGHQVLRRPAHRGHVRRGVQVRLDRQARPPGHLVRAAAHRQVHAQPAHLRGRDRADLDPHAQLVARHQRGPQPRRPPGADRRQEQGGVHLQHRPAGADPRARHPGAEGHPHGRHDAEPRQRGAAVGGRQLLPQQAADARRHRVHREARRGAERRRGVHPAVPVALRGRDPRRLHPGRRCSRPTSSRC